MDLYSIRCKACQNPFSWFSGDMDQRCSECKIQNKWENSMITSPSLEQQLIDTLKSVITTKDELIEHLKAEIARLKSAVVVPAPLSPVTLPMFPYQPVYQPGIAQPYTIPNIQPNPLQPPYFITCGDTSITSGITTNTPITGTPPPPLGSQQSLTGTQNTNKLMCPIVDCPACNANEQIEAK